MRRAMAGLARVLLLLICVVPIEQVSGVRSPSHDAVLGHLRGRKGKQASGTTAFTGNALPRQFAGLDRLARSSCVSKHGEAACAGPLQQGRSGSRLPGAQPDIKSLAGGVGGGGAGLEDPRRKRTLSVRRGHRGKGGDVSSDMAEYKDISFEKAWESSEGFMAIYERTVEMPGGGGGGGEGGSGSDSNGLDSTGQAEKRVVKWHVLGSPKANFSSVVVFPWCTRTQTCTLIREYCPGTNSFLTGIPAGSFEPGKHESIMQAAADELNEEAGLQAARLIPLTMAGIPADKYSANRLYCFIALDCTILQDKRPLDDTEDIVVERGVTLDEVMERVESGEMAAPSAMASLLAISRLRSMDLL